MTQPCIVRRAERQADIDEEIARLKAHRAKLDAADLAEIAFFEAKLEPYYDWLRDTERLGRRTDYPLTEGVLRKRGRAPAWQVKDPEAFARWLKAKGLVRVKEEPAIAELNARIRPRVDALGAEWIDTVSGEPVPGLIVGQASREVFAVEAK
jgi:phage host-nuclease inhibitor protein Gam